MALLNSHRYSFVTHTVFWGLWRWICVCNFACFDGLLTSHLRQDQQHEYHLEAGGRKEGRV